jgi:hypothetical protein
MPPRATRAGTRRYKRRVQFAICSAVVQPVFHTCHIRRSVSHRSISASCHLGCRDRVAIVASRHTSRSTVPAFQTGSTRTKFHTAHIALTPVHRGSSDYLPPRGTSKPRESLPSSTCARARSGIRFHSARKPGLGGTHRARCCGARGVRDWNQTISHRPDNLAYRRYRVHRIQSAVGTNCN